MYAALPSLGRSTSVRPVLASAAPGAGAAGSNWRGRDEDSKRSAAGSSGPRRSKQQRQAAAVEAAAEGRPRRPRQKSPDETPLRDANRDRLMGLLTERAAKTLLFYFSELNPTLMQWLEYFMKAHPIPQEGHWEDVCGDTFLRKLLSMPVEETRWNFYGRESMYAKSSPLGVDPRQIAQRIMEIRAQIAREWVQELQLVSEENALLIRETVASAFAQSGSMPVVTDLSKFNGTVHPELLHPDFVNNNTVDDSAAGSDD